MNGLQKEMKKIDNTDLKGIEKERDKEKNISWKGHRGRKFGAVMHRKQKDNIRIVFGNINTLPKNQIDLKLILERR